MLQVMIFLIRNKSECTQRDEGGCNLYQYSRRSALERNIFNIGIFAYKVSNQEFIIYLNRIKEEDVER